MRVLLIEDDTATAQSIELMLKSENFNIYVTDLGEEGIDLGKLYDYDIILLDLNLPDMSGYEVLRSLRVTKIKTPILILSGMAGIEDAGPHPVGQARTTIRGPRSGRAGRFARHGWYQWGKPAPQCRNGIEVTCNLASGTRFREAVPG